MRDAGRVQTVVKWVGFILAGVLAVGALLDAISNAVAIVSPRVTYVSSAVLVVSWLVVEGFLLFFGIPWRDRGALSRVRGLGRRPRFVLFGACLLLWIPRLGDLASDESGVPAISLKLANSGNSALEVERRGELVLWLPTALYNGAPRVGGRFSLKLDGESGYGVK